jgi:hypothetical protein
MKIQIENYRGWDVLFDTEKETFYAQSDEYDTGTHKKSFASAKKYIDDFIKDNAEFKPFWVTGNPNAWSGDKKPVKIIGIRKDKRFVYESSKDGSACQVSEYDENKYMLIYPENEAHFNQLEYIKKQIGSLRELEKETLTKFKTTTLKHIKSQY